MKHDLLIHYNSETKKVSAPDKSNLLNVLQENDIPVSAPCGGHGTCGKCRVEVTSGKRRASSYEPKDGNRWQAGNGERIPVLACEFVVDGSLDVYLPDVDGVKIQSESYYPDLDITYDQNDKQEYGIAIDVGTTTVVVYLEDLLNHKNIASSSFMNPQKSFGADVISRIQYAGDPDGLIKLQSSLVQELDHAINSLCLNNKLLPENISQITVAGNTTMLHLLKGVDPSSLAQYPFTPVFLDEQILPAKNLGFNLLPDINVTLLPSISAYVGADIVAGIAASEMPDEDEYSLFIDIGTNGEMALGNRNEIMSCATAAGPAFEGAKISCGLGGVNGAVHSFSSNGFSTIGNAKPSGLCGSGLIDVIAWLLETKQLDPSGYLEDNVTFLDAEKTVSHKPLQLTPLDIREVQLAKGAIAAGIETLIEKKGIKEDDIHKIYLAGGFGYALHPETAARIGLFPPSLIPKIIRAGNTAGLGARLSLHSKDFKKRVKKVLNKSTYFELSNDMSFNEKFVMKMGFEEA